MKSFEPIKMTDDNPIPIDSKAFENHNASKCNLSEIILSNNTPNMIHECSYLLRIVTSLKYYDSLMCCSNDEFNTGDVFTEFMKNTYTTLLEDYIHLVERHSNDIMIISSHLKAANHIKQCALSACKTSRRRYAIRERNITADNTLKDYNFELDLLGNIHFYLFHLEETGLRVIKSSTSPEETKDNNNSQNNNSQNNNSQNTDYEFKALHQTIMSKQNNSLSSVRLNGGVISKFNIYVMENLNQNNVGNDGKNNTFVDNLFENIKTENNKPQLLYKLSKYIQKQHYDTDALSYDVDNSRSNCNIFTNVFQSTDNIMFDNIYSFIKYYNISATSFNTGLTFWYWDWYKNINDQQYKIDTATQSDKYGRFIPKDEHDLSGYSIRDLFVQPHYSCLKDEVIQSLHVNIEQFNTLVVKKANKYYATATVKAIKCEERGDPLHYGIKAFPHFTPLHQQHLHSLFLYCDFTDFSQAFSSSFRAIKWNEPLSSIRDRNSKYYHVAKYLREMVQYYGIRGSGNGSYYANGTLITNYGPFYTGMSQRLTIGSFSIRLNGPTSTSLHIEIAARFAKRGGIIIQINNYNGLSRHERYFNCRWVSAYPEEEEALFCGGRFQLEIQSIRIVKTSQNYGPFFKAFHLFDSLLSGTKINQKYANEQVISKISMCIDYYLNNKKNDCLDTYITDTFHLFVQQKTQIRLNLDEIFNIPSIGLIYLVELNKLTKLNEQIEKLEQQIEKLKGQIDRKKNSKWQSKHYEDENLLSQTENELNNLLTIKQSGYPNLFESQLISKLFKNVTEITIEAKCYEFNVSSLLWMFYELKALNSITVKAQHYSRASTRLFTGVATNTQTGSDWLCGLNDAVLKQKCRKNNIQMLKRRITKQSKSKRRSNVGNIKEEDWLIMKKKTAIKSTKTKLNVPQSSMFD